MTEDSLSDEADGSRSLFHRPLDDDEAPPGRLAMLETARLLLRPPQESDALAIVHLADSPRVARNLIGMPHPYRVADARAWIAAPLGGGAQKHLVCLKQAGGVEAIGAVTLEAGRGLRPPRLGYWLGEDHWGLGFATEACHAVIDYAFLHQGHERLSFCCRVTNSTGRRVIEKCGFQMVAQELGRSFGQGAVVAVDRFELDRRCWQSLRGWEPLRLLA